MVATPVLSGQPLVALETTFHAFMLLGLKLYLCSHLFGECGQRTLLTAQHVGASGCWHHWPNDPAFLHFEVPSSKTMLQSEPHQMDFRVSAYHLSSSLCGVYMHMSCGEVVTQGLGMTRLY